MKRFRELKNEVNQAIQGVKSIDNWFSNNPKKQWSDLSTEVSSVHKSGFQANPLRYDKKFIEICKSIPFSPKYQYQLLQLILQIPEDIMKKAEEEQEFAATCPQIPPPTTDT
jgi:hypothetical protein